MPDRPWADITQPTLSQLGSAHNIPSATTWSPRPQTSVDLRPNRAPTQPPTKFVITPNSS
jgi:hypothetical protein